MIKQTSLVALAFGLAALPMTAQQGRPQIRLDDSVSANTPDGFDIHLDSDGDLWVASWVDERDPVNTFDDDIFIAVSTDGGKPGRAFRRARTNHVCIGGGTACGSGRRPDRRLAHSRFLC